MMLPSEWNESVALELAQQCGLTLSSRHWEAIRIWRDLYFEKSRHPVTRLFIKALKSENATSSMLELMQLFGEKPLYTLSMISGLPKPPHCL